MKITKSQLKQIIKEELKTILGEKFQDPGGPADPGSHWGQQRTADTLRDYKPASDPGFGEVWTADIWRGYQEGSPSAVGFDEPSEPDNPEYMYGWKVAKKPHPADAGSPESTEGPFPQRGPWQPEHPAPSRGRGSRVGPSRDRFGESTNRDKLATLVAEEVRKILKNK